MDFNPRFSPADWLLVQRTEFKKERDLRWKTTYDKAFFNPKPTEVDSAMTLDLSTKPSLDLPRLLPERGPGSSGVSSIASSTEDERNARRHLQRQSALPVDTSSPCVTTPPLKPSQSCPAFAPKPSPPTAPTALGSLAPSPSRRGQPEIFSPLRKKTGSLYDQAYNSPSGERQTRLQQRRYAGCKRSSSFTNGTFIL
eukprot:CAMPEP_0169155662 /NCGR_PEP_ID=MMETSP1015-20121227/53493_1 /TAXON_ID=342587 /ORGANISM="Karlodinium micrum, Strain CCMP2283" /LENGTH=196 /DNA_ID=CAMNT_0009226191 /DNA_START=1 /DNA_END=591 /DNA_ORIENTATION=+